MKWTALAAEESRHERHVADVASRRLHEVTDRLKAFGGAVQVAHAAEYAAIRTGRNGGRTQLTGSRFRTAERARSTVRQVAQLLPSRDIAPRQCAISRTI